MKFWAFLICILILPIFAQSATLAEAQKAYVTGQWKDAAKYYEEVCYTLADSLQTECLLWNVLALSQTGAGSDFKKAGKRLDSLIEKTKPEHKIYADLILTKAQFLFYLGKFDQAAETLIHSIETARPHQYIVLQKVCGAVQAKAKNERLALYCEELKKENPEFKNEISSSSTAEESAVKTQENSMSSVATLPQVLPKESETILEVPKNWYLQLGAFAVKNNADMLVKNLKKKNILCKMEEKPGENKTFYIVIIEGFESKEKAIDFGAEKLSPLKIEFNAFKRN